jgi:aspartate carbamoyltransferase catalytic subunit
LVGDLKYGRTVHSLLIAMSHFNPTFNFISPNELKLPKEYKMFLEKKGIAYEEFSELADNIKDSDILYMTRVQGERFADPLEYEKVKNVYILKNKMLENTKPNLKILHPLPRVNEISTDVDSNEKAYYFQQALNGVFTRQAIMAKIFGLK